jgi:hypothetical protein
VIFLTSLRMRRKSWKCFNKMASRNVSKTFTVSGRSVMVHKHTLLKKIQLKFIVLYFSEIKWFREHFRTTMHKFLRKIFAFS